MGARGKLKLPSHLAAVPDADDSSAASVAPRIAPTKPAAVSANETLSALWDEIVPQLDEAGLLAPSDGPAVELALRHFAAARRASDTLSAGGDVEFDAKNDRNMKNPAEVIFRSQSMAFLEYAKQLGMTFVARARTPLAKGDEDGEANPFRTTGG